MSAKKIPNADELATLLTRLSELTSAVEVLLEVSSRHCDELEERRKDLYAIRKKILEHQLQR